jgi:hydrogenase maturation protein HypF
VGFRPFVYRLATELALAGWVLNDTHGVSIEVEGPAPILATFLQRLPNETPPNARILHWSHTWLVATGATQFESGSPSAAAAPSVSILPDLAPCPACQAELFDPNNRRFQYPFTNCTHCGPRFTILEALPYDRPNTTMQGFALCPACLTEYNNPLDRRFHAQPNACPVCGPELAFYSLPDVVQQPVPPAPWPAQVGSWQLKGQAQQAFDAAVAALRAGAVVAVKGLGGFQLMADARNAATVARLRAARRAPVQTFGRDGA